MWSNCCKPAFLTIRLSVFFWSHKAAGACSTCHWAGGEVHPGPVTRLHTERPQAAAVRSTLTTAPQCYLLLPQVAAKRTAPCGTSILASFFRPESSRPESSISISCCWCLWSKDQMTVFSGWANNVQTWRLFGWLTGWLVGWNSVVQNEFICWAGLLT